MYYKIYNEITITFNHKDTSNIVFPSLKALFIIVIKI